jgi:phosphotransferase system HPr (HPr) family protein
MLEKNVKIINPLGLHARAAAQLVRLASTFESDIKLIRPDNQIFADAKSILSVLTLAANKGTELILQIVGEDENEALKSIEQLINQGFGEI